MLDFLLPKTQNLTFSYSIKKAFVAKKHQELHQLLTKEMLKKGTMPDTIIWPEVSGGKK